jgi:hypothetical protein
MYSACVALIDSIISALWIGSYFLRCNFFFRETQGNFRGNMLSTITNTLVTTGCIWKCKRTTMLCKHLPIHLSALLRTPIRVYVGSSRLSEIIGGYAPRRQIITAIFYSLFFNLPYIKEHCSVLWVCIVYSYIYVSFFKIGWWICSWNPHCRLKNSPNALSVQLCEQHTVAVAIHLQLYFHSDHTCHCSFLAKFWNAYFCSVMTLMEATGSLYWPRGFMYQWKLGHSITDNLVIRNLHRT